MSEVKNKPEDFSAYGARGGNIRELADRRWAEEAIASDEADAETAAETADNPPLPDPSWPTPDLSILDRSELAPPKLPLKVFGTYWRDWIAAQAKSKGAPQDYVAASLLSGASVLIGNAAWGSPWHGWAEPPIIWTGCIGLPSSNKSPAQDAVRDILAMIEEEANSGYKDELTGWDTKKRLSKIKMDVWEAACKTALKDKVMDPPRPSDADEPERPPRKRIVTSDTTVEKLARNILQNPKGMMVFRDELSGWLGNMDKYGGGGGDRSFYLEGHGGRSYAVDRMKDDEPLIVPALIVVICGGIQPDRLVSLVLVGDDDGLAARILYVWPERVPPVRPTSVPPTGAKAKLTKLYALKECRDAAGNRILLSFDEEAAKALQEYRLVVAQLETGASGLYLSWLGKLPGMTVRLANIFEHLWWCGDDEQSEQRPETISAKATKAAIQFLKDYATPMANRCFGEASLPQVDQDAKALARWIVEALREKYCSAKSANSAKMAAGDSERKPNATMSGGFGTNGTIGTGTFSINARAIRRASVLHTKDVARYDAAIAELETDGWLRLQSRARDGASPGRGRKDWDINPNLMAALADKKVKDKQAS